MGFRVVTLNLNGIRSAATKGFEAWAEAAGADFMGVQEVRAQEVDVAERFKRVAGLDGHFHFAVKKGYSGVGLYTKRDPSAVITGFGCEEFDPEGRYVELRFDTSARKLSLISAYFPSGSSGEERQAAKFRFLERFWHHLAALRAAGREFILMGDFNIAHQALDLKNWRGNQKNSGFLPEERAWFSRMVCEKTGLGLVDVYRRLHPEAGEDCYTWWSNRGQAWAKNVGWRLDYQVATPEIAHSAHAASVHKASRFSDHAPLTVDYGWAL